jgi:hypothetical protein
MIPLGYQAAHHHLNAYKSYGALLVMTITSPVSVGLKWRPAVLKETISQKQLIWTLEQGDTFIEEQGILLNGKVTVLA